MTAQSESCFKSCQELLQAAEQRKILIHGAVSVSHAGKEIFRTATHGNPEALYDIASLTKVVSGLTLFLIGEDKGLWEEESRVGDFLQGAGKGTRDLRLRELLAHESGLAAWRDYYNFKARDGIFSSVLEEDTAEKKPLYSDLGYILLTKVMETATGKRVDRLWEEWGAREGWDGLRYSESLDRFSGEGEIIPTENTFHRRGFLVGVVNDDNCFRMDSTSLHAGLFGNLGSVRNWFWALWGGAIVPRPLVLKTIARENGEFYSGWIKKSENSPNAGSRLSNASFGMLGFTGCSFFYDPERDLLAVFLASRVNPTHDFTEIRRLRKSVYDAVVEGFDELTLAAN
ncbi:MAG: serine hydrolase [Nitrospinae bacterium]|nr:serine hydrolase [Nitrospinota bacterium]